MILFLPLTSSVFPFAGVKIKDCLFLFTMFRNENNYHLFLPIFSHWIINVIMYSNQYLMIPAYLLFGLFVRNWIAVVLPWDYVPVNKSAKPFIPGKESVGVLVLREAYVVGLSFPVVSALGTVPDTRWGSTVFVEWNKEWSSIISLEANLNVSHLRFF
jgi:hypothetical protein